MIHSLHFRLLAAFALVIIVIIGSVFFFTYQTTRGEIGRFGEHIELMQTRRVEAELSRFYHQQGRWEGIQPFVTQWSNFYGRRIILTDTEGVVVADSEGELMGKPYETDTPGRRLVPPLPWKTDTTGFLHISAGESPDINQASLQIVYRTIGRCRLFLFLLSLEPSGLPNLLPCALTLASPALVLSLLR